MTLQRWRTKHWVYGQQHQVTDVDTLSLEAIYFMTEETVTTHTTKTEAFTRALGNIFHLMDICALAWVNFPVNALAVSNQGWATDDILGKVYWKGQAKHILRNQSNETMRVTLYYCRARKDYKHHRDENPQSMANAYTLLGDGFAVNGLNNSGTSAANAYLADKAYTPFNSYTFTKVFKIYKTKNIKIGPGKKYMTSIFNKGTVTPNDLTLNTGTTATSWPSRTKRWDQLRGEKFILFKVHANISGALDAPGGTKQTTFEKVISETLPTVIMYTQMKYQYKHLPRTQQAHASHATAGINSDETSFLPQSIYNNTLVASNITNAS